MNVSIAFNMTKQYCDVKKTQQIDYSVRKREIQAGVPDLKKEEISEYVVVELP